MAVRLAFVSHISLDGSVLLCVPTAVEGHEFSARGLAGLQPLSYSVEQGW